MDETPYDIPAEKSLDRKNLEAYIGFGGFFLIVAIVWMTISIYSPDTGRQVASISTASSETAPIPSGNMPEVGSTVHLRYGDPKVPLMVYANSEALSEGIKASNAQDIVGLNRLSASGLAFFVKPNTKALLIKTNWAAARVRLKEGSHAEQAVWIDSSFVHP